MSRPGLPRNIGTETSTIRRVTPEEELESFQMRSQKKFRRTSKSLGFEPGHELKDWREAESEILHPLNCGFLVLDNRVEVNTDAASFGEGEIQICVEPQTCPDLRKGPHQHAGNRLQVR